MSEVIQNQNSQKKKRKLNWIYLIAAKKDLNNAIRVDTSAKFAKFAKKVDLTSLKSNVDKLGFEKLKNVPSGLNSLKIKQTNQMLMDQYSFLLISVN